MKTGGEAFQSWLSSAEEAYKSGVVLAENARYPYAIYTLCQAIEKSLKAVYIYVREDHPKKTHNLLTLAQKSGLDFTARELKSFEQLFTHYNRVRYHDLSQAHYNTKTKTTPIIKQAQRAYQCVLKKLENH